jgi:hypothetical protein
MAINLTDNIRVGQQLPVDSRYFNGLLPWDSLVAVTTGIPTALRFRGLTVNILGVEYWWADGILDAQLVIKTVDVTLNLQEVTDEGSTTTNSITANSFIKQGGTSSEILAADGDIITAGNNITITNGEISSIGGSGGGGSTVNYYLNGGTSQGTFGGTTYYEFSKTAVIGTRVDFSVSSDGYIASFITDVADPSLLLIPIGNWIIEFYFSANSAGGSPSFYVELYKVSVTNVFTLISSSSATPEGITNGDVIDAYFTTLSVPETTLDINDRLAIRVFVNASGKTITLHTQDETLCEVLTTFTTGLTALNGLQAQVQNFATGTTGTDFAINSSGSVHTFNLPSASATARGVVTTASQTFAGGKTFSSNPKIPINVGNSGAGAIVIDDGTGQIEVANNLIYPNTNELTYVKGVTSGIQTQLNAKSPLASPTFTGTVVLPSTTSIGNVSSTEIGYLDGVTSGIQTSLDGKVSLATTQTITAAKTFSNNITASANIIGTNTPDISNASYNIIIRNASTGVFEKLGATTIQPLIYNILITSAVGITTQTLGTNGGLDYSQDGRNVMIDNGSTAIQVTATNASSSFIASYTKLGTGIITFASSPAPIAPYGTQLNGNPGSTALLTKNGTTVYLLVNNLL